MSKSLLDRIGVSGYNKPKRTPNHPTKSHVVVAKEGDEVRTIRFGQQGVSAPLLERASLKRQESAGSHLRRDMPRT